MPITHRIFSDISRLMTHSRTERRVLLASAVLLPLFWLGLHMLGLARFQAWLNRRSKSLAGDMSLYEIHTLAELVGIAARRTPLPATCLTRSLLLDWLLHRRGVPSRLRIGVRFTRGLLKAHAWVEFQGIPVNDKLDVASRFTPFDDLPFATAFGAS
jgi:hypothetical protein